MSKPKLSTQIDTVIAKFAYSDCKLCPELEIAVDLLGKIKAHFEFMSAAATKMRSYVPPRDVDIRRLEWLIDNALEEDRTTIMVRLFTEVVDQVRTERDLALAEVIRLKDERMDLLESLECMEYQLDKAEELEFGEFETTEDEGRAIDDFIRFVRNAPETLPEENLMVQRAAVMFHQQFSERFGPVADVLESFEAT